MQLGYALLTLNTYYTVYEDIAYYESESMRRQDTHIGTLYSPCIHDTQKKVPLLRLQICVRARRQIVNRTETILLLPPSSPERGAPPPPLVVCLVEVDAARHTWAQATRNGWLALPDWPPSGPVVLLFVKRPGSRTFAQLITSVRELQTLTRIRTTLLRPPATPVMLNILGQLVALLRALTLPHY